MNATTLTVTPFGSERSFTLALTAVYTMMNYRYESGVLPKQELPYTLGIQYTTFIEVPTNLALARRALGAFGEAYPFCGLDHLTSEAPGREDCRGDAERPAELRRQAARAAEWDGARRVQRRSRR